MICWRFIDVNRYVGFGASIELSFFGNSLGAVSNLFIKKAVFEELNGFGEDSIGYEDWEFGVRLLLAHKRVQVVPESLYWNRDSPVMVRYVIGISEISDASP